MGQTRTPIKDIQRERGTSLEHIMVGTEYGMAPEMTHGPAAGCASCTEDSTKVEKVTEDIRERERERGCRSATEYIVSKERGRKGERMRRRGGNGRREKREIG